MKGIFFAAVAMALASYAAAWQGRDGSVRRTEPQAGRKIETKPRAGLGIRCHVRWGANRYAFALVDMARESVLW
jgi:hypothetical protein